MKVNELKRISDDCQKLRSSIFDNKVVMKANKEQEDTFYRMLDSFINRIKFHMDSYLDQEYIKKSKMHFERLETENDRLDVTFNLDKMKENLYTVYMKYQEKREKGTNFIAATEPTIFYPIRIIVEKLYRELTGNKLDESLNLFFEDKKI